MAELIIRNPQIVDALTRLAEAQQRSIDDILLEFAGTQEAEESEEEVNTLLLAAEEFWNSGVVLEKRDPERSYREILQEDYGDYLWREYQRAVRSYRDATRKDAD